MASAKGNSESLIARYPTYKAYEPPVFGFVFNVGKVGTHYLFTSQQNSFIEVTESHMVWRWKGSMEIIQFRMYGTGYS